MILLCRMGCRYPAFQINRVHLVCNRLGDIPRYNSYGWYVTKHVMPECT